LYIGESDQRHWEIEHRLFLSNHFLYCLTYLPLLELFATGGEDGSVIIFSFEQGIIQTISHPKTVWAVTTLPYKTDLVTGCMDAICRIFTRDESRMADNTIVQAFHANAGTKKVSNNGTELPKYKQVYAS
jgi:WD40 repeat protein